MTSDRRHVPNRSGRVSASKKPRGVTRSTAVSAGVKSWSAGRVGSIDLPTCWSAEAKTRGDSGAAPVGSAWQGLALSSPDRGQQKGR